MTRHSDRNADALLQSARSFLEHSSGQRELVLARIERRLAEQAAGAVPGAGQASLAEGGGLPTLQRTQNGLSAAHRARSGNASWPRLVSVGVVMGVAGFLLGRSQLLEPARVLSAAPVVAADERPPPSAPAMARGNGPAALRAEPVEEQTPRATPKAEAPRLDAHRDLSSARPPLPRAHPKPLAASLSVPTSAAETTGAIDLLEALARVRRAESERLDGRLGDALATLDELERLAPAELLREERLLERTLVECDLGNRNEAARSARELARYNPNSIYLRRLEGSCAAP